MLRLSCGDVLSRRDRVFDMRMTYQTNLEVKYNSIMRQQETSSLRMPCCRSAAAVPDQDSEVLPI
jgi:hypothetical protein